MKTVAIIFIGLIILNIIAEPFLFGTERKPYSAGKWLLGLPFSLTILYILLDYSDLI